MAISLENPNLVWQRVKNTMDSLGSSPEAVLNFRDLKQYLETAKGRPLLQFVPISNLIGDTVVADAACTIYAIYLKKQATSTSAFVKANDSATTAGGANGAAMTDTFELNASGLERVSIEPGGRAMGSGITIASETTGAGGTDTTTGDGPNGFVILGA